MRALLFFDGSAFPTNPGHVIGGAVLKLENGTVHELSYYAGEGTNNVGEYLGLIIGLRCALEQGVTVIDIKGDSDLIVRQVTGQWKSKKAHLTALRDWSQSLLSQFDGWELGWIPREQNTEADAMTRAERAPKSVQHKLMQAEAPRQVTVPNSASVSSPTHENLYRAPVVNMHEALYSNKNI